MYYFRTLSLSIATTLLITPQLFASAHSNFSSDIFAFEDITYAKGCQAYLSGEGKTGIKWEAHPVALADIPYHVKAFGDATIMAGFATGQTRSAQSVADRITNWIFRFLNGHPHGGMTILNQETQELIGHIVAGGGDGPGVSEMAYTLMEESWDGKGKPGIWGKGIMSDVVGAIVNKWAPEVRRLSSGKDIPEAVRNAFTCFGGERLKRFDATASPSNPGSWYILKKHGFTAAKTNVKGDEAVADFDNKDLDPRAFENALMVLYTAETSLEAPLIKGIRYQVVGTDGSLVTVSHHTGYDCMKLHVELPLE